MHFSGSRLHILCAYACRHGTCSMTPQQENALRSIARQANSEIKKARQQFPDKNVDDICRSVLKKHRETVTLVQGCRTCASCQEDLELISKQRGSK
nr:cell division protein ZapA [Escherichia coli]